MGVLARNAARAAALPRDVHVVRGRLKDAQALREGAMGADVVFHLAAATSGPWATHVAVTVEGTRQMLRACDDAGVRRFVLVSSIVVYDKSGFDPDTFIDEAAPLLPDATSSGACARGKLEAEALAASHTARGGRMEIVIVRPGLIYGPQRLAFAHLGELVGASRVAYGPPSLLLPLVEVGSCTDALVRAATSAAAPGKIYNVADAHRTTRRDYLRALELLTGHRQRVIHVPVWPVAAACGAAGALARFAGSRRAADLSARKIRARAVEVRYDTTSLQRDTRWRPLRDLGEGLARAGFPLTRGTPRVIKRVGIVGAGAIARVHVAALRKVAGVRVTGILDTNLDAARALAAEAGGAPAFADAERFFAEAAPELVHVLTPPRAHAAVALEALRRGCHLLLEKPATTSLEDCDTLLAAAAADLTIGVDETVAWDPLIRRARAALLHGVLGDLVHVDIFMGYDLRRGGRLARILAAPQCWERELAGGPLEDLLPHPLSVARALCGPLELKHAGSASTGRVLGEFPDELRMSLGAGSVTANIGLSLSARPDDFLVTIHGTRATAHIDVQNMLFDCATPLPGPRAAARGLRVVRSALRMLGQTARNGAAVALRRATPPASPVHLIRAHYAALARGAPPPAPLYRARADIAIARSVWPEHEPAANDAVARRRLLKTHNVHTAFQNLQSERSA